MSRLSDLISRGWEALAEAAGRGGANRRGPGGSAQRTAAPENSNIATRLDAARDRLRASISSPSDDPAPSTGDTAPTTGDARRLDDGGPDAR